MNICSEFLETCMLFMIVFQVSLNFDTAKEILKIRFQIYIIILRKIQAKMKTFHFTILQSFQFELEQKKTGDNESHEKGTTEAVVDKNSSK